MHFLKLSQFFILETMEKDWFGLFAIYETTPQVRTTIRTRLDPVANSIVAFLRGGAVGLLAALISQCGLVHEGFLSPIIAQRAVLGARPILIMRGACTLAVSSGLLARMWVPPS